MAGAEELLEAARLMRQRARAATVDGRDRWVVAQTPVSASPVVVNDTQAPSVLIETFSNHYEVVNEHVAAFASPVVALAVAEWLDMEARMIGLRDLSDEGHSFHALKVARAYLGGAA